jgi:hypothetical protein
MLSKFIFVLMLSLGFFTSVEPAPVFNSAAANSKTSIEQQHATTHRIAVYDLLNGKTFNSEIGHCSSTVVGRHALLTAQHCFMDSNLIRLDTEEKPTVIISSFIDGNDHVIYIVNRDFSSWVSINERPLVPNEPVHFWGAPGSNSDVYRSGYFVKMTTEEEIDPSLTFQFELFILPTFGGDSGSGVFDENGNVVAVTSMGDKSADSLDLPLAFSQAQLDAATK